MAKLKLLNYTSDFFFRWNDFVEKSNNGTIFHRLDFLSYHGERFTDKEHHLIWMQGEQIIAVMPMAIFNIDGKRVAKSPYGGSYGGIVTKEITNYSTSREIVSLLIDYLKVLEVDETIITMPLSVSYKDKCDTLFFCLLEKSFRIVNSDISNVVVFEGLNLETELFTSRARNMARKAIKSNVSIRFDEKAEDFWRVLSLTYQKHASKPTHSYDEWLTLCNFFPQRIWMDVAYINDRPIAGIGHIMVNSFMDSSFYLCTDPLYSETQALTLLIYKSLLNAQNKNAKMFDFGTSSINMSARENIFRFKESFGARGFFRHTLKLFL